MMIVRKPLRERETILSSDVADAIERLIDRSNKGLPLPLDKDSVISELIQLAHLEDDGTVSFISKIVERALAQSFTNRLTNSSVFSAGYQHYEKRSELPVVPVTEFFFKVVFSNGDVSDCLEAMSDFEIRQSLPKRRSPIRSDVDGEFLRDDEGDVVHSGSIAGIIVFPPNNRSALLCGWLERRANTATGQMAAAVKSLTHARPNSVAVQHARERAEVINPSLKKALPQPKR